jgi:GNAT superfamily N-acetyltransferase
MPQAIIRPAKLPDARPIAEVHVRAWRAAYAGLIPDATLANLSVDAREQVWRELLARDASSTLVLLNPTLVGWVSFGPARDPEYQRLGHQELYGLYLLEAHWGQGLGRRLYQEAERCWARTSAEGVILWVLEANARARRFYERVGYRLEPGKRDERVFAGVKVGVVCYRKDLRLGRGGDPA